MSHTIISNRKWTKSSFFESITEIKRTPKCLKNFMGATTCNSIYVENGASSRLYSWTPHFNLDDPVPEFLVLCSTYGLKKGGGGGEGCDNIILQVDVYIALIVISIHCSGEKFAVYPGCIIQQPAYYCCSLFLSFSRSV